MNFRGERTHGQHFDRINQFAGQVDKSGANIVIEAKAA